MKILRIVTLSFLLVATMGVAVPGCGANEATEKMIEELQKKMAAVEDLVKSQKTKGDEEKKEVEDLKAKANQTAELVAVLQGKSDQAETRLRAAEEELVQLRKQKSSPVKTAAKSAAAVGNKPKK